MSLMNLQLLGTSHTIHSTACVTHEPTTVRYKSHNPFNCLCHSWTYNHQVQVIQSIQMYVTHEPTTVWYKSHNPFNCMCHSWTYNHQVTQSIQLPVSLMNHQVQVTQYIQMYMSLMNLQLLGTSHTIHSTACVTHEPTTVRYKSHNPFNCLCHSWTYNRQVQVT